MNKQRRFLNITIFFAALVVLRPFGEAVLYDPLEIYFKNDYLKLPLPEMNLLLLGFSVSFKYLLNSLVSIQIIRYALMNEEYTEFAMKIYIWIYALLITFFLVLIIWEPSNSTLLLFYVRRFLMHPLLILILIPAFYYQELKLKKG